MTDKTFNHLIVFLLTSILTSAQTLSKQQILEFTPGWEGERFEDGRPKVPDAILERMRNVSIEEAWSVLRGEGFHNQFEGEWLMIHSDRPIVGRAVTAQYMPNRPDVSEAILKTGRKEGGGNGRTRWQPCPRQARSTRS